MLTAQSGTGKTSTFCFGVLQQLDYFIVECQALVLAPTRELAQQIENVMRALSDYLGVKVHACIGGTSVRENQRILSSGVHVIVGTPTRVFDMLRRQSMHPDYIKMFVLDESDEMLSRGFKDQANVFKSKSGACIAFLGEVDDKYQYMCENKDNKVHGWICLDPLVGFWQITPSNEFRTGGPLKQNQFA